MSVQRAPENQPGIPFDTFPVRLRVARFHAGDISIEKAAGLCGVKPATWSTWERGVHRPPHFEAMVKAIAAGLGVDEDWLRDGGPLLPEPPGTPPRPITFSKAKAEGGRKKPPARRGLVYNFKISAGSLDCVA